MNKITSCMVEMCSPYRILSPLWQLQITGSGRHAATTSRREHRGHTITRPADSGLLSSKNVVVETHGTLGR